MTRVGDAVAGRFDSTYEGLKPSGTGSKRSRTESGFDSTYEGLKPKSRCRWVRKLSGFDSTYEGLKLALGRSHTLRPARFDSTYEGLKPDSKRTTRLIRAVSTVPMRA